MSRQQVAARSARAIGLIPARMAATRLPGKPLIEISGKPMIQHAWERARQATALSDVLVATPDDEIRRAVEGFGGHAIMTSDRHRSGTDRVAEAAHGLDAEIIVNIQGDEPLIDPAYIDAAIAPLAADPSLPMSSLMCACPEEDLDNPACVKVVVALSGDALYFSRARIPFERSAEGGTGVRQHIGLYAYRRDFLAEFARLPATPLERTESLEQLRAIEHGFRIRMVAVLNAPLSVDTPEDLSRVRHLLAG